jgi:hypothetical protein
MYKAMKCYSDEFNNIDYSLGIIESLIKIAKENCFYKECDSNNHNLNPQYKKMLSEERNNYINLLSVLLDEVLNLRKENNQLDIKIHQLKQDTNNCGRQITA